MKIFKPKFWNDNNMISVLLLPFTFITTIVNFIKKNQKKYKTVIPTICVGNIYLGGTGKTQLVIKLNEILKTKFKTYVIKKKYEDQVDEQKLLEKKTNLILPKKRLDGLKKIQNLKKSIAIFDDGLQDKSINYTLSIVCFSSLAGFGNKKLIPAGPLRESLNELKNYDAIFINGKENYLLTNDLKKHNKKIKIFYGKYILKNKKDLDIKSGYLAFCGIGTPQNFFQLLKENKIKVQKKIIFPDHYEYSHTDITEIIQKAKKDKLKIVTTEKDFMKVKKFGKNKIKFTNVDLKVKNYSEFNKFLYNYI